MISIHFPSKQVPGGKPKKNRAGRAAVTMLMLLSLMALPACAQNQPSSEAQKEAQALNSIGLFSGTEKGFELERTPTRAEALVMLLKLTGQAGQAEADNLSHPFQDGGWASPYIGYAYTHQYTSGLTETEFGTTTPATAQQYAVFLLRSLGYAVNEDYTYENALPFFLSHTPARMPEGDTFTRGDMVSMSMAALAAPKKDGTGTLAEALAKKGLFSMEDYRQARDGAAPEPEHQTTVLVYMVASNLESSVGIATEALEEMLDAELNDSVQVVLQTGGTKSWQNHKMSNNATQRFLITEDDCLHLATLEDALMSYPDTLANFLRWGVNAYPAERYILVFWNHGGGTMKGFGVDQVNQYKLLSLGELSRALDWADTRFDLVGFDACLMATLTNAYVFREYTDYLLASEENTSLAGWNYTEWLTALARDPALSVEDLSRIIIDGYLTGSEGQVWNQCTMSLLDLTKSDTAFREWQAVLAQLNTAMKHGQFELLEQALQSTKAYGETPYDQLDLLDYLTQLERCGLAQTQQLRQAAEQTILQKKSSANMEIANGLAVYVPYLKYDVYQETTRASLLECGFTPEALEFFDAFAYQASVNTQAESDVS